MTIINLPRYDLQTPQHNTYYLKGFSQAVDSNQQVYYRPRLEPTETGQITRTTSYDFANIRFLFSSLASGDLVRTLAIPEEGIPAEYNSSLTNISFTALGGLVETNPVCLPFTFGGILYLLTNENRIYSLSGGVGSAAIEVTTTLRTRLGELNLTQTPTAVEVWQNRVWIAYGRTLIWCDSGDITEWRIGVLNTATNQVLPTLAGNQEFGESREILQLAKHGRYFYVFLDNEVYSSQVLNVAVQFGFVPLNVDIIYQGGGVSTRNGYMFFANNSVYVLNEANLTEIGERIRPDLPTVNTNTIINTLILGNDVFWVFRDSPTTVIYDLIHNTINLTEDNSIAVGTIIPDVETIGELTQNIGDITQRIRDLGGESDLVPIALTRGSATSVNVESFAFQDEAVLRLNLRKDLGFIRSMVHEISIPELGSDWSVRIKDNNDLVWGHTYTPDSYGNVRIHRPFTSPDLEIRSRNENTVSSLDITFTELGR